MKKVMNHAEYQKSLTTKSFESLRYTLTDAVEAAKAMPNGENAGYYLDEAHYCLMEMKRREPVIKATVTTDLAEAFQKFVTEFGTLLNSVRAIKGHTVTI